MFIFAAFSLVYGLSMVCGLFVVLCFCDFVCGYCGFVCDCAG